MEGITSLGLQKECLALNLGVCDGPLFLLLGGASKCLVLARKVLFSDVLSQTVFLSSLCHGLTLTEKFWLKPFFRVDKLWLVLKIACLFYENGSAFLLETLAFN